MIVYKKVAVWEAIRTRTVTTNQTAGNFQTFGTLFSLNILHARSFLTRSKSFLMTSLAKKKERKKLYNREQRSIDSPNVNLLLWNFYNLQPRIADLEFSRFRWWSSDETSMPFSTVYFLYFQKEEQNKKKKKQLTRDSPV